MTRISKGRSPRGWRDGSAGKALAALAKDQVCVPSTHVAVHNCLYLQLQEVKSPLLALEGTCIHMHIPLHRQTCIHIVLK